MSSPTRAVTTWSGTWSCISWSILLWFHPLVWRIRAAHLAACDAVCDALAADLVGDVASYGRTLARLALQVAGPAPVPGLAMARTPDVFLRIESLQRRVFRSALPWRLIVPALLALGAVVILIGGFGITRAPISPQRERRPNRSQALRTPLPTRTRRSPLRVIVFPSACSVQRPVSRSMGSR